MGNERNEGKVLRGQQFDPRDLFVQPYTQQELSKPVADELIGQLFTEITPTDMSATAVKTFDLDAIQAQMLAEFYSYPGEVSFSLPDELTALAVVYSANSGAGEKIQEPGYAGSSGDHGGLDVSAESTAQASAAIIPDITYTLRQFFTQNVICTNVFFNLAGNSISWSDIQTKLTVHGYPTVHQWPQFKPEEVNLNLTGSQTSVSVSATSQHSDRWSSGNVSASYYPVTGTRSDGYSTEVGVTSKSVRIPPTVHAAFTLSPGSVDESTTVTVKANIPAIVGTGPAPSFDAITNEPTARTVTATASVSPTSISATSPTAVPKTGLYARTQIQSGFYGTYLVHVEIVDFAQFA